MTQRLAAATVALLVGVLACSPLAPAATWDGAVDHGVVGVEQPPLANLSATDARELALDAPELARALRLRPDARVVVRWYGKSRTWTVNVVARTGTQPSLASASIDDPAGTVEDVHALPLGDYPPRLTERQAIDAAVGDRDVRRAAREFGGLRELRAAGDHDGCCWQVDLFDPDRTDDDPADPVVRVDVTDASGEVTGVWTGIQIPWSMARGEREAFGGDLNQPAVWYALLALFVLVVVDWTRLRSVANLDALVLVAFAASYEAFLRGAIDWSVPLAAIALVWLALRMGWLFARGVPAAVPAVEPRTRFGRLVRRRVPTMLLVVLCVLLAGMRIGITLDGGNVIDVGYASVAGARAELRGVGPWGELPADVSRGDTYGPANYLAYVPATALLDDGADDDPFGTRLPAAQATAIATDLASALLLLVIGWRWISRRAGVLLVAGWLACPWTTLALASGANDALVSLALLAAFALLSHAWLRGAFVGVATMVKFAPAVALAALLHVGMRRRSRQALQAVAGFAIVVAAGVAWAAWRIEVAPDRCSELLGACGGWANDLAYFHERTIAFQTSRDSPFSPWGLYDRELAQQVLRGIVALAIVVACARPRVRDAWQVAAGIAALLAAVQLTADHWFYLYLPWLVPFVLLVLVARRERPGAPPRPDMLPT